MSRRYRPSWLQGKAGRRFRLALYHRYGNRCFYCRRGFADWREVTSDHFIPRALWPRGYPRANIVPACEACNKAKDSTLPAGLVLVLMRDVKPDIVHQAAA